MIGKPLAGGFRLIEVDETTSTNDLARGYAEAGEPAGLVIRAGRQTAGRGRQGRSWLSPEGNLYTSLLLRPRRPMTEVSSLSLVVGLVLCETIGDMLGGRAWPAVKWPNDVLVDGAKVAGILLEGSPDRRGGCEWVVAGVGVNIGWAPGASVGYATTCLATLGLAEMTPAAFLAIFLERLQPHFHLWDRQGFAALRATWLGQAAGIDRQVVVKVGSATVSGTLVGVDETGALQVATSTGRIERFAAGEMALS